MTVTPRAPEAGPATDPAAGPTAGRATILVLGLISAMGSMAIHMLAPVLPMIQHDLAVTVPQAQLVVGFYLVGLGFGQLITGPLVDRLGAHRLLFAGIVMFIAGSLASVFATSLTQLLAARLVQALGGAAGLVTARVLVADLFGTRGGASRQATLMTIVLISPAFSPVVGSWLSAMSGWRLVPLVLAVAGVVALLAAHRIPGREHEPRPPARASIAADLARLARNRGYVLSTAALAASSGGLYMFLSSGAFILQHQFGLDEKATGICFLLVAVAGIFGTRLVRWIDHRTDTLLTGSLSILLGALIALALANAGAPGAASLIAPMLLLGIGAGLVGPAAINLAVNAEPGLAGTGASITGAVQMLISAVATVPLGLFAPITSFKLALALCCTASLAFAAALARRRFDRIYLRQERLEP